MDEATAEAHDRESRIEEATRMQESEKKSAEMPPDDGEWGSWQRKQDACGEGHGRGGG